FTLSSATHDSYGRSMTLAIVTAIETRAFAGPRSRAFQNALDSQLTLALETAVLLLLTALILTRYWQDHVWLGFAALALATIAWVPELCRARVRRWWFVYVAGTFCYTLLRSSADETGIPVQYAYPVTIDQAMLLG